MLNNKLLWLTNSVASRFLEEKQNLMTITCETEQEAEQNYKFSKLRK